MDAVPDPATPRRWKVLGSLLIIAGLAVGVFGFVGAARTSIASLVDSLNSDVYTAPASTSRHLHSGNYLLLQLTQSYDSTGNAQAFQPVIMAADQVRVSGPAGALRVDSSSPSRVTLDGNDYVAFASFRTPHEANYDVDVSGPDGQQFVVVRDLPTSFGSTARYLRLSSAGGALVLIGLPLLIIGIARARPVVLTRPAFAPAYQPAYQQLPPAGWYFDPARQGQRYWTGERWLE